MTLPHAVISIANGLCALSAIRAAYCWGVSTMGSMPDLTNPEGPNGVFGRESGLSAFDVLAKQAKWNKRAARATMLSAFFQTVVFAGS